MNYESYKVITEQEEFNYKQRGRAENKFWKLRNDKVKVKLLGCKNDKPVALLSYNDPANDFNPLDGIE